MALASWHRKHQREKHRHERRQKISAKHHEADKRNQAKSAAAMALAISMAASSKA